MQKKKLNLRYTLLIMSSLFLSLMILSCTFQNPSKTNKNDAVLVNFTLKNNSNNTKYLFSDRVIVTVTIENASSLDTLILNFGEVLNQNNIQKINPKILKIDSLTKEFSIVYNEIGAKTIQAIGKSNNKTMVFGSIAVVIGNKQKFISKQISVSPKNVTLNSACTLSSHTEPLNPNSSILWLKDFVFLPNQSDTTLVIPAFSKVHEGTYICIVSNEFGSDSTLPCKVQIAADDTIQIIKHPMNQIIATNNKVRFECVATVKNGLYQWYKNNQLIPGANETFYEIVSVTLADNNSRFKCKISNLKTSVETNEAILFVTEKIDSLKLIVQPVSQTVILGSSVTFTVVAAGTNATYIWQKNNTPIPGAIYPSYTIPSVQVVDNTSSFKCIIKNSLSTIESQPAVLVVHYPPTIKVQPKNVQAKVGEKALFSIEINAGNPAEFSLAWKEKGKSDVLSVTKDLSFIVNNGDNGKIYVCSITNKMVKDTLLPVISAACTLTVTENVPIITITEQPKDVSVKYGEKFSVSVKATVTPLTPLKYKWFKNDTLLSVAKTETYQRDTALATDAGTYYCLIYTDKEAAGIKTNKVAVTVIPTNTEFKIIKELPKTKTVLIGKGQEKVTALFKVEAVGQDLRYNWYYGGMEIKNQTNPELTFEFTKLMKDTILRCIITNVKQSSSANLHTDCAILIQWAPEMSMLEITDSNNTVITSATIGELIHIYPIGDTGRPFVDSIIFKKKSLGDSTFVYFSGTPYRITEYDIGTLQFKYTCSNIVGSSSVTDSVQINYRWRDDKELTFKMESDEKLTYNLADALPGISTNTISAFKFGVKGVLSTDAYSAKISNGVLTIETDTDFDPNYDLFFKISCTHAKSGKSIPDKTVRIINDTMK